MQEQRIRKQQLCSLRGFSLDLEATHLMHGLRCQTKVRADGNTALSKKAYCVGQPCSALEFDHVRPCLHQFHGIIKCRCWRRIGAKRHVGHHQHVLIATGDARGMVGNLVKRHGQGRLMALTYHSQGVPDQDRIDTTAIHDSSKTRVITGQHGDFFTFIAHRLQRMPCHGFATGFG